MIMNVGAFYVCLRSELSCPVQANVDFPAPIGPWVCKIPGTHHQIKIHAPTEPPLPIQQKIEVVEDRKLFARWEFLCHASSLRTLAAEAGWTDEKENAGEDTTVQKLPWFIGFVKRHVKACQGNPTKYALDFHITGRESAYLVFAEIVHDYRRVEILRIDLSRPAWTELESAACSELQGLKAQQDLLMFRWLKTIEIVSLRRPSLLSDSLTNSSLRPSAHCKLHQPRRPERVQMEFGACSNAEVFNSKRLGVHVMSYPESYIEPGKTSPGPYCSDRLLPAEQYSISIVKTASAYKLMVGNPKLPFLHYTSEDVTEKHIEHLTRTFAHTGRAGFSGSARATELASSYGDSDTASSSSISSSDNNSNRHWSDPIPHGSRRRHRKHCTTLTKPASQPTPLRRPPPTVPSVIFDDFLAGCTNSPDSYRAVLVVHTHTTCHPQHRAGLVLEYRNLPDQRWHPLIVVRLRRTRKDLIAQHMEEGMRVINREVLGLRTRLARLLEMLRMKDMELLWLVQAELGKYEKDGDKAQKKSAQEKTHRESAEGKVRLRNGRGNALRCR
ncbi:hypothetical protein HDU86_007066 [Geranomyces michiganensis]|nr:hypothetical protein HDU86_007066 [Geranomyces michiganensis]